MTINNDNFDVTRAFVDFRDKHNIVEHNSFMFCKKCGTSEGFEVICQAIGSEYPYYAKHECGLEYKR